MSLVDVAPSLLVFDIEDRHSLEAIVRSDDVVFTRVGTDVSDVVRRKIAHDRRFRFATLADAVRNVVRLRPEEQMVWANACRCVATMQHFHRVRQFAVRQHPRNTMCVKVAPSASAPMRAVKILEAPVTITIQASLPKPARFSLQNFRPEAICEWYSRFSHATSLGSVVRGAAKGDSFPRFAILA